MPLPRAPLHAFVIAAALVVIAFSSQKLTATLIWDWSFVEPEQIIAPTDIARFEATLSNSASSDEHLVFKIDQESDHSGFNILGSFGFAVGPLDALWGAYPHSDPLWVQFVGLDLAPGESFTFDLFTFYPVSGIAPDGYVLTNSASLTIVPNDQTKGRVLPETISREWTITVDASVTRTVHPPYPPSASPVPDLSATGFLLGIALASLALAKCWRIEASY